ncbi:MAG: hypothetical protein K2J55_06480, partial [Eubacterium sp.]|nr:hypothetical protein [Eubacterium sp.]
MIAENIKPKDILSLGFFYDIIYFQGGDILQTKEELMSLGLNENEAVILSDIEPIVTEECFVDNNISFDFSINNLWELYVTLKNVSLNFEFSE